MINQEGKSTSQQECRSIFETAEDLCKLYREKGSHGAAGNLQEGRL